MGEKDKLNELCDKIERGLQISFEKLIAFKKYKNTPFIFSKNGEIVEVSADEVEAQQKESRKEKSYKKMENVQLVNESLENPNKKKPK